MEEQSQNYKSSIASQPHDQGINATLLKNSMGSMKNSMVSNSSPNHQMSFTEQQGILIVGSSDYNEKYQVKQDSCRRISYQLTMFFLTFFNYAILHSTRSAWSLATSDLTSYYEFRTGLIADMNATFLFFYSLGGIFLGHLADKYAKPRLIFVQYTMIAMVQISLGCLMYVP